MCEIYKNGNQSIFICSRKNTTKKNISKKEKYDCSLNNRNEKLLAKSNIKIQDFKAWNIANKKKLSEICQIENIEFSKQEKSFFQSIFAPNDYIHKNITLYKKYIENKSRKKFI
jgi:hypothetical protein